VFRVPGHVPQFADASTMPHARQSVRSAGILPAAFKFEQEAQPAGRRRYQNQGTEHLSLGEFKKSGNFR